MGLVVNDVVKMEWDEAGWVQTKVKKDKKVVFVMTIRNIKHTVN